MKRIVSALVLVVLFLCPQITSAKEIPCQKIAAYGITAYHQRCHNSEISIKTIDFLTEESDTVVAVFNFSDGGFLLLSTDDAAIPVIGYSLDNNFPINDIAPATREWLQNYMQQIRYLRKNQIAATDEVRALWAEIATPATKGIQRSVVVPALLHSTWNQSKYYNALCPVDSDSPSGYDGRVPCGCVALAMSSVVHYYRYPKTGHGSYSYQSDYGTHSVNFGQQTYCYEAMPNALHSYNNEVAKLIYHCATSVNMHYSAEGSGTSTEFSKDALEYYYNYDSDIDETSREYYNTNNWIALLINNIDAKHPIIYRGYNSQGGHAFVCDGYDSDNNFHFNWGWGGSGNGFYTVANNEESSVGGYSYGQGIVYNIYPPESAYPDYCPQNNIFTAVSGTVEDGSGSYEYQNNTNCTYIIAPESATNISINPVFVDTEEGVDTLSVWDGDPNNGGHLLATFSGNTVNTNTTISSNSGVAYLTFKTNGNTTGQGWQVEFSAEREIRCNNTTRITDSDGTITDGSGDSEYASGANCIWRIEPTNAAYVNLTFEQFDLSPEDKVYIYDKHAINANLIGTYTGSTLPQSIHSTTGKVKIVFKSDNYLQRDGFVAHWTSGTTSIKDNENQEFDIFPNPSSDHVYLTFPSTLTNGTIRMIDMNGKTILQQDYSVDSTVYQIDIQSVPVGIYLLSITNGKELLSKKLIIQR